MKFIFANLPVSHYSLLFIPLMLYDVGFFAYGADHQGSPTYKTRNEHISYINQESVGQNVLEAHTKIIGILCLVGSYFMHHKDYLFLRCQLDKS
jgi:hypothetical protein